MAPAIAKDFGISLDLFFAAFTVGLLIGGIAAPIAGREIDRRGARQIMRYGSVLGGIALIACAISPNFWFFAAATILAEIATCMVFYEAAFAALTQIHRHEARRSITAVTLIAGFASTIFWPLTQWLVTAFGWRWGLCVFALMNIAICAPIHHLLLRKAVPLADTPETGQAGTSAPPPMLEGQARRRAYIAYAAAVCISSLIYSAVPIHMLRIISHEGMSTEAAALVAMVMGPAQVLARLVEVSFGQGMNPLATGRFALGMLVASLGVLLITTASTASALVFAACYGISQGLITIARGTVPLYLFGAVGYATLVGKITGMRFLVNAAGPLVFATLSTRLSMEAALGASMLVALVAFIAFLAIKGPERRDA
ncbi:MAG: MFS transporter, partial [Bosea sp. (in: a-proteobacteria)]